MEGYRGEVPFTAMGLDSPPGTEQGLLCEPTDADISQVLSSAPTDWWMLQEPIYVVNGKGLPGYQGFSNL